MEKEQKFYIDLLDTIHCYFIHGYDTGYSIKADDLKKDELCNQCSLHVDPKISEDDSDEDFFHDHELQTIQNHVRKKRKTLTKIDLLPQISNSCKFVTTVHC